MKTGRVSEEGGEEEQEKEPGVHWHSLNPSI